MSAVIILWTMLGAQQRRRFWLVMALMAAGAAAELLTIGFVISFLALLTNGNEQRELLFGRTLFDGMDAAVVAAIVVLVAGMASACIRLALTWQTHRLALGVSQELASRIFSRALHQPYQEYVRRSSSDILAGIEQVQSVTFGIILPLMQGIVAGFIALFTLAFLLTVNFWIAASASLFVVGTYAIINLVTGEPLKRNSEAVADAGRARIKIVQEGFGGFRDLVLDRSQSLFEKRFRKLDAAYREAQGSTMFIAAAPRFIVEGAAVATLALIALLFSAGEEGIAGSIPILGALALAAQRLLPLVHQAFVGWSRAAGNLHQLFAVIALAGPPRPIDDTDLPVEPLVFEREIAFEELSYNHAPGEFGLHEVSFAVGKGERVGVTGLTGSGKSTLLDLLMGLLEPTSGSILVDGRVLDTVRRLSWRRAIAHVPQSVHLLDDTILANIAFGLGSESVDMERVRAAAAAAQIDAFINALPLGYQTKVGERGIRLSGGQRQRLAVARALYKDAPVLILDEATNALDEETEGRLLRALWSRDLTVVIVSHRSSTLQICDAVIRLDDGRLTSIRRQRDLVLRSG